MEKEEGFKLEVEWAENGFIVSVLDSNPRVIKTVCESETDPEGFDDCPGRLVAACKMLHRIMEYFCINAKDDAKHRMVVCIEEKDISG